MTIPLDPITARTVETAHARYEQLTASRSPFLERARTLARLTIPFLYHYKDTALFQDFQSLGARCVNNLAAKLMLVLFPPGATFFKLAVDDYVLATLPEKNADGDARGDIEAALTKIERAVTQDLEKTGYRAAVSTALRHLLVGGNGLLQVLPSGKLKFRSLNSYVVQRDLDGNVLEIITKDMLSRASLPANILAMDDAKVQMSSSGGDEKNVAVYTRVTLQRNRFVVEQEVGLTVVPGSKGSYPKEQCPFLPLLYTVVEGEDYGRGYAEEFQGDLSSYESLQQSLVGFAAVASKILIFVDESGMTSRRAVQNAANGAILEGRAADLTAFQLAKGADFQISNAVAEGIKTRLEQAFLMGSSAQRNAERVTAEEIRLIAGELEQSQGGIYSILAQELQLPLVSIKMAQLQRSGKIPTTPKDTVAPQIITGLEGLGRNSDLQRLQSYTAALAVFGPAVVAEYVHVGAYATRLAAALSIDVEGMVRSDADVTKARSDAAQSQMQQNAVAPVINAMAKQAPPPPTAQGSANG